MRKEKCPRTSKVQYEEMLPHELEAALAAFPVAYVPFGSLEWHGRHLPYGVNPRLSASAEIGRCGVELMVETTGPKARQFLAALSAPV